MWCKARGTLKCPGCGKRCQCTSYRNKLPEQWIGRVSWGFCQKCEAQIHVFYDEHSVIKFVELDYANYIPF